MTGGGPAGCAAAIRLADAGHDVLEVLAPDTQHELRDLGVALEGDGILERLERVRNVYPARGSLKDDLPA